ncbi:DHH family phosphoesterase [Brevibacillus composti]|uniref:Cyclic-di-AMP phosphodiesterase n=1 Tax=Brevibacillus composti TaxID=2796470 RepID=A0A7T5EKX0_9BACL|nr:DHH family phosphoesterase [Brevibacillus composti]QQE74436.1 DHH family phosphoesterase [Brevibacillus composti]QUO41518.1 DHH family phosphoesterase [Brevibacillus composti]
MPKFLLKRWYGLHMVLALTFSLLLLGILTLHHWMYGAIGVICLIGLVIYVLQAEKGFQRDLRLYLATVTHRVKKAGEGVIQEMPIGILLYNEEKVIEWVNPFMTNMSGDEMMIGKNLLDVFPQLTLKPEQKRLEFVYNERTYEVLVRGEERLLYFTDITNFKELTLRYHREKAVLAIIHLDNLDEVGQVMDDQSRTLLSTSVAGVITEWANRHGIYLRRVSADKFLALMERETLDKLEESRFDILDVVREMTADNKIPITLSIGAGAAANSYIELGQMAQSSLDIALGRGGDQAAVKIGNKLTFFGGKSNAVEKRTRVRARVIAHALRDLIHEAEHVIVMGHKQPDMDSIGASLGVLKAVQLHKKDAYIVMDEGNSSVDRLMKEIYAHEELAEAFITPEQAIRLITGRTLLVVVDTHRPSLVIEPRLLEETSRIVVIDHHRRSEEFIEPVLLYLEPYASSTSELVTELLQYQSERLNIDSLIATALLAGIVVDTKSFAFRTGSRTFEAASFLRRNGADTAAVQRLLKEDLNQYVKRARVIMNTEKYRDNMAIAVGDPQEEFTQVQVAQAAEQLLTLSGIQAAFVVARRADDTVLISARSLGDINVQSIMEHLGGGGHLTAAANQMEGVSLKEAVRRLKEAIDEVV